MSKLLMTPGPTNIPTEVQNILGQDMIHHRFDDFHKVMENLNEKLKKIFFTKNDVYTMTCSGTGVMETAVVNLFSKGEKVAIINVGNFGKRFVQICQVYGLEVIELEYNWGETYNLEDVKKIISENSDLKGIFVTHSETSTGVLNNIKALGELTKNSDILLVVDVISGMIVNEFKFDEWNVDCAVAGSQKGFLLPPGIAFVAISDKAKKAIYKSDLPKFYFDLKQAIKYYNEKKETPWTPAIPIIRAAEVACDILLKEGIENIQARHTKLRKYVEDEVQKLGFKLFVKNPEARGNTLVTVYREDSLDLSKLRNYIDNKYNITIAGGQGKYAGKILRFGCLGLLTIQDFKNLFEIIKKYLEENN
ncbi:MAG: hypothetical protein PWP46_1397 [Fusobacteriaceae bacterium]|nr:hypothetical protein [Fusobacteriaceae bacterium]